MCAVQLEWPNISTSTNADLIKYCVPNLENSPRSGLNHPIGATSVLTDNDFMRKWGNLCGRRDEDFLCLCAVVLKTLKLLSIKTLHQRFVQRISIFTPSIFYTS